VVFIVFTDSPACAGGGLSVYTKFCTPSYRGLKKNTLQLKTLFALSNLWMVRHQLLAAQG